MTFETCFGNTDRFLQAREIRTQVFVLEQNIPLEIERDSYDETSWHIIAYKNQSAIATGRLFKDEQEIYRIGRLAVLQSYRGSGIGESLLNELILKAWNENANEIEIHAQMNALEFYNRVGFYTVGNVFVEAGIDHITMKIDNPNN